MVASSTIATANLTMIVHQIRTQTTLFGNGNCPQNSYTHAEINRIPHSFPDIRVLKNNMVFLLYLTRSTIFPNSNFQHKFV